MKNVAFSLAKIDFARIPYSMENYNNINHFCEGVHQIAHNLCIPLYPRRKDYPLSSELFKEMDCYSIYLYNSYYSLSLSEEELIARQLKKDFYEERIKYPPLQFNCSFAYFSKNIGELIGDESLRKSENPFVLVPNFYSKKAEILDLLKENPPIDPNKKKYL